MIRSTTIDSLAQSLGQRIRSLEAQVYNADMKLLRNVEVNLVLESRTLAYLETPYYTDPGNVPNKSQITIIAG